MVHRRYPSGRRVQRKNGRNLFLTAALVAISLSPVAFYANLQAPVPAPAPEVARTVAVPAPSQDVTAMAASPSESWTMADPQTALKPEALDFAHNAPLAATFEPLTPPRVIASVTSPARSPVEENAEPVQPASDLKLGLSVQPAPVPLPVPRPAEFRIAKAPEAAKPEPMRMASAAVTPAPLRNPPQQPSAPLNNPSFFEKLFGIKPATPPESALAYADVDNRSIESGNRYNQAPATGAGTAVYDITAKVVIMPNGERLEAHSGLGDKLDDPRFVNVRMRGPTPPGTYVLSEREALFHGVRALRLTPVGGSGSIYGRDGILAHTFMLGPNGDSNGCVSFRDYNRFLQAYLRGEVKRLVVVSGHGQDALPRVASTRG